MSLEVAVILIGMMFAYAYYKTTQAANDTTSDQKRKNDQYAHPKYKNARTYKAHELYRQAIEAREAQDQERATTLLKQAAQLAPTDADIHGLLAQVYLECNDYSQAVDMATQAIAMAHTPPYVRRTRAYALFYLHDFQTAQEDLDYLIANRDDSKLLWYALRAWTHFYQGDIDAALVDMAEVPENHFKNERTYQGRLHLYTGSYLKKEDYSAVLLYAEKLDDAFENKWAYLAIAHSQLNQPEQAMMAVRRGLQHCPESAQLYNIQAFQLAGRDDLEQSLGAANQAITLDADYSHSYSTRAHTHWLLGDFEAALTDINTAIATDKSDNTFGIEKTVILQSLERTDDAHNLWQRVRPDEDIATLQERYQWHERFYAALRTFADRANADE